MLLGTVADEILAVRFGRTLEAIKVKRGKLGLVTPAPRYRAWTPEENAALGTAPDRVIAARLGRTYGSVLTHRQLMGIPPAPRARSAQAERQGNRPR